LQLRAAVALLCAWLVIEFTRIWPDHLSYFNQAAGGARGGVRWLDDSNVDWGQGLIELRRYIEKNRVERYRLCSFSDIDPKRYGIEAEPVRISELVELPRPGVLITSSHCVARAGGRLRELYGDGPRNWLAHVEPTAFIGHAYWLYDVPGESVGTSLTR
jgi:hypothetical protein